jgi:Leucine-rich repeat (LRR) protein
MMAENELRVLGAYVGGWTRVVELDASHNAIKLIDPAIGEMGALRRLKLRSNGVAKLPAEMGLVTALQALALGYRGGC